ncbi:MAG: DUF3822 family protein [Muribaculaceae bacterium]|nr:DUF3822 family protein [Muribaculaceae bacterium]MDE7081280.1 DUF3822 family protein [Muribaculaceae bacterium]
MAEPSSPIILTPADFADTGQWRLLIYITHTGMRALLRHATDRERPLLQLLHEEWEPASAEVQMSKIENTVYAHPSLLDDYATEVVVETPRVAWMPDTFLADGTFGEESVYHTVFADAEGDVLTDRTGEATALYEFLPEFDSFMARTLPGARLRCHLGVLVERFLHDSAPGDTTLRIYMDMRDGEADLVALRSGRLVSASVQPWHTAEEAAYRIFHLLNAYATDRTDVKVSVNGTDPVSVDGVLSLTAGFCREAKPMQLSDGARRSGLPLSAALLVYKQDTI